MPVIGERYLSVVSLTVGLFVASASTSQVIDRTEALTAETWNSLCILQTFASAEHAESAVAGHGASPLEFDAVSVHH